MSWAGLLESAMPNFGAQHYAIHTARSFNPPSANKLLGAEWLAKANPILIGSDNMGIEVVPHADKDLLFPVHQIIITTHGIFLLENLNLDGLARDKTSEFAFVVLPLKI
jgi:hypothetical protein